MRRSSRVLSCQKQAENREKPACTLREGERGHTLGGENGQAFMLSSTKRPYFKKSPRTEARHRDSSAENSPPKSKLRAELGSQDQEGERMGKKRKIDVSRNSLVFFFVWQHEGGEDTHQFGWCGMPKKRNKQSITPGDNETKEKREATRSDTREKETKKSTTNSRASEDK